MEKTLKIINELEAKGLIERYAIGGAVAGLFYTEPDITFDLDVFVFLPVSKSPLVTLSPIYDYLKAKGYREDKEHLMIEGVPVQFLPAYNALVEEAVTEAKEVKYRRVKTRVLRAEYLLAIMLQTGRPKDKARIDLFLREVKMDKEKLGQIFKRHNLREAWSHFRKP